MALNELLINDIQEGRNSIMFKLNDGYILYEKLKNSLHSGKKETLSKLQDCIENIDYNPKFSSDILKSNRTNKIGGLLLNITEYCNLKCYYCIYSGNYEGERINNNTQMDFNVAKSALDFFAKKSGEDYSLVAFYGGEPATNFDFIEEVINYAIRSYPQKNFVFSMTSNFYNVETIIEKIIKNNIYINVSLDGPKEVHDKYRVTKKNTPTFDRIIKNLKILNNKSPGYVKTHIGLNGTCHDPADLGDIVDYFIENDNNYFSMRVNGSENKGLKIDKNKSKSNFFEKYAAIYINHLLSQKNPPKVLKSFFDFSLKNIYARSLKEMPEMLNITSACYPSERKLFVDTDGKYYMCEKIGRRLEIGDFKNGLDYKKIDEYLDIYTSILNEKCTQGCWCQRLCTPCIQSAKDAKSSISITGLSQKCNELKSNTLIGLAIYVTIIKENPRILEEYFKYNLSYQLI